MITAKEAFNTSYSKNIEAQEELHAAEEYIEDTIKQGKFYVMIPYRLNYATCTILRQYGYDVYVCEVSTTIRWDEIHWSEKNALV